MNLSRLFEQDKKLLIKVIAGVLFIVVAFAFYIIKEATSEEELSVGNIENAASNGSFNSSYSVEEMVTDTAIKENTVIIVDVGGEVLKPSVVKLKSGSRVYEAIEKAGGLTANADTKLLNQAEILTDGQKLYVPSKQEVQNLSSANQNQSVDSNQNQSENIYSQINLAGNGKININTADTSKLQELTGVGPSTAEKIINYRNENGNFKSIEDLKNVSGIGDKTFAKFKDKITV